MGVMGYESTVLKALGFLSFKCKNGLPTTPEVNNTVVDNSTVFEIIQNPEESESSNVSGLAAGILLPLVFLVIVAVSVIVYKRRKAKI